MKNKTHASALATIATNATAKNATAKNATAELENAPKKSATLSRADFIATNAIRYADIKPNDRLMFNDAMHAASKKIDSKIKYALILAIDPKSKNILALVDDAPYVFDRVLCDKYNFAFAKIDHAKNDPDTATFSNVKLTVRNLTHKNTIAYFAPFMTHKMIVDFRNAHKSNFAPMK